MRVIIIISRGSNIVKTSTNEFAGKVQTKHRRNNRTRRHSLRDQQKWWYERSKSTNEKVHQAGLHQASYSKFHKVSPVNCRRASTICFSYSLVIRMSFARAWKLGHAKWRQLQRCSVWISFKLNNIEYRDGTTADSGMSLIDTIRLSRRRIATGTQTWIWDCEPRDSRPYR